MKGGKLRVLNLDDNLISSFQELENLGSLSRLKELILRSKQTDNPICRNPKYVNAIVTILSYLDILDGVPLAKKLLSNTPVKEGFEEKPVKENSNPNLSGTKLTHNVQEELKDILHTVFFKLYTNLIE